MEKLKNVIELISGIAKVLQNFTSALELVNKLISTTKEISNSIEQTKKKEN